MGVVIPTTDHERFPNTDLVKRADWVRSHLTPSELQAAQLPRVIPDRRRPVSKPESWYARPDLLAQALALGQAQMGQKTKVYQWLNRPNPHWGNTAPLDMLEAGGWRYQGDRLHACLGRRRSNKTNGSHMSHIHHECELERHMVEQLVASGWQVGDASTYDKARALYPADVLTWLQSSQPQA